MAPEGLYLHIPYCYDKCTYCDFHSAPIEGARPERYLAALRLEIASLPSGFAPRTVFLGGGTPTALAPAQIDGLLDPLARTVDLSRVVEFSVEANPGTVTARKLELLRARGANRISIGAQSFDPPLLARLGRIHNPAQIAQAVHRARAAGFENLGLDLIFALPGQTPSDWTRTLERAVALEPEHLSAYGLTYEAGTPLHRARARGEVRETDEETQLAMLRRAVAFLGSCGYRRYEISNYALPGRECAHNRIYWENREYHGLGSGATSYVAGRRYRNVADPAAYAARIESGRPPVEFEETLDPAASFRESVAIGLRMCDGVDLGAVEARTGLCTAAVYDGEIEALAREGLLAREGPRVRLTARGLELADEAMARLV